MVSFHALWEQLFIAHETELAQLRAEIRTFTPGNTHQKHELIAVGAEWQECKPSPHASAEPVLKAFSPDAPLTSEASRVSKAPSQDPEDSGLDCVSSGLSAEPAQSTLSMCAKKTGWGKPKVKHLNLEHIRRRSRASLSFSKQVGFLKRIVEHKAFEAIFCLLVFLNTIVMALEVQYRGLGIGYTLSYRRYDYNNLDTWPGAQITFHVLTWFFGIIFAVEIAVKMIALRTQFLCDHWNYIDSVIVMLWIVDKMGESILPVNSQVLRLARLGRLLRILKLVRKIQGFDALFLMTTAIKGSVSVLFWTFLLLSMVQLMMALLLNQVLQEFYFREGTLTNPSDDVIKMFEYFGTFTRCFFSMFEMTLANWPPACRLLVENVSDWFIVFGMAHKLSIGFAVLGVINGVFMSETFKCASQDDILMVRTKERAVRQMSDKMMSFFLEADESGDGQLSLEEFLAIVEDPQIRLWLAAMDLDTADAPTLFSLIDESKDGALTFEELVKGVTRLKGNARSIDVIKLQHDQLEYKTECAAWIAALSKHQEALQSSMEANARAAKVVNVRRLRKEYL